MIDWCVITEAPGGVRCRAWLGRSFISLRKLFHELGNRRSCLQVVVWYGCEKSVESGNDVPVNHKTVLPCDCKPAEADGLNVGLQKLHRRNKSLQAILSGYRVWSCGAKV